MVNCGVSGAALTTTANQTGEPGRLCNWINEAWEDIQTQRQDWQWMRKTATFTTVANQPIYTISQIGLTDFGHWSRDTFRNYANPFVSISIGSPAVANLQGHLLNIGDQVQFFTSGSLPTGITQGITYYVVSIPTPDTFTFSLTAGGSPVNTSGTQSGNQSMTSNNTTTFSGMRSEIFMEYMDYDGWRNSYEYGALRTIKTRPLNMTITPNKSIGLGPFPDSGYTVLGDYYSVPVDLVADTDVPAMPAKFHLAIIYKAMMAYGAFEAASEVYDRGEKEYNRWIRRIHADQEIEMTSSGPLA